MKTFARIAAIASYLPDGVLTNAELAARFPGFTEEKILEKTGIRQRRIAGADEYASDLGIRAAEALFKKTGMARASIDFLVLCTQSPDFLLPSTASKIHQALGLPRTAGTLDYQQGCAGYVYALGLVKGLIETGQARTVLLVNADTVTKHVAPNDRSTLSLFGDAATATLITADTDAESIGPFVYLTDGAGREHITSYRGGLRAEALRATGDVPPAHAAAASADAIYMNGPEVFRFVMTEIPALMGQLDVARGGKKLPAAHYVFHQANGFMLNTVRKVCGIPQDRFLVHMADTGNTSSCSIPLVLEHGLMTGRIRPGDDAVLVGFGVGYSAAATRVVF